MNLRIYVAEHCWGCDEAQEMAAQMRHDYPELTVEVIDLNRSGVEKPDEVFAIPTYLLNGRVVSLGNPNPEVLCARIEAELGRELHDADFTQTPDRKPQRRTGRPSTGLGASSQVEAGQ